MLFFPNEMITEILNIADYQTWINEIKYVNRQYHSYYIYNDLSSGHDESLCCKKHNLYAVNWRSQPYCGNIEMCIYPICVNSNKHESRYRMISHIELPHNY